MIPVLMTRGTDIAELCRRFHVSRLDVFGSAARERDFSDESDIDLLAEYDSEHYPPRFKHFLALREALKVRLSGKVDLTMAGTVINPFVLACIERSRERLR